VPVAAASGTRCTDQQFDDCMTLALKYLDRDLHGVGPAYNRGGALDAALGALTADINFTVFVDFICIRGATERHCDKCERCDPESGFCTSLCGANTLCQECNGECVDVKTDFNNCGSCDRKCVPRATCCDKHCVDTGDDPKNCGNCGHACPGGTSCEGGDCSCPDGALLCGPGCTSAPDPQINCGTCGNHCLDDANPWCVNGNCAPCDWTIGETFCAPPPFGIGGGPLCCDAGASCCAYQARNLSWVGPGYACIFPYLGDFCCTMGIGQGVGVPGQVCMPDCGLCNIGDSCCPDGDSYECC